VKRSESPLASLVSARLKARRRPPATQGQAGADSAHLKLVGNSGESRSAPANPAVSRADASPGAIAAPIAIRDWLSRLAEIIEELRAADALSAKETAVLQSCIDLGLAAIDMVAGADAVLGPQINTRVLGALAGQPLASLRSGQTHCIDAARLEAISGIVRNATAQISAVCLRHEGSPEDPASGNRDVAMENLAASARTCSDVNFAAQISRLTRLDVLAQTTQTPPKRPAGPSAHLRVSRSSVDEVQ